MRVQKLARAATVVSRGSAIAAGALEMLRAAHTTAAGSHESGDDLLDGTDNTGTSRTPCGNRRCHGIGGTPGLIDLLQALADTALRDHVCAVCSRHSFI